MKILIASYRINNFGGIINHTHQLINGLVEIGHEVSFATLVPASKVSHRENRVEMHDHQVAMNGLVSSQSRGFITRTVGKDVFPYASDEGVDQWCKFANQFDLVIWTTPVQTKSKATIGDHYWPRLYQLDTKQIGIIHDGNLISSTPWIYHIAHHFTGLACVHLSAYHSAELLPNYRGLIVNPQDMSNVNLWVCNQKVANRLKNRKLLAPQTFKRWKRVDDLIRAFPYVTDAKLTIAGGGIEHNYMTSIDKVKPEYLCNLDSDPECPPEWVGRHIWHRALDSGMEFLGYISSNRIDEELQDTTFLVDPSWSIKYSMSGDHFNRVMMDASRNGVVTIATNLGMSSNLEGLGEVFKPNENYLMIPYDSTVKEYAERINEFLSISEEDYKEILFNNYLIGMKFDRKRVAQQFIDLMNHEDNDSVLDRDLYTGSSGYGFYCKEIEERGHKTLHEHFKIYPE